jgi:hypothetical protein
MEATTAPETYESEVLDHLGLVAGMYDELQIGTRIDEHIAQDFEEREVSVGQAVKAMVLNGFGFVQQALYLTPQFFKARPRPGLLSVWLERESGQSISMTLRWEERSTASTTTESLSSFAIWRRMGPLSSASRPGLPTWMRPVSWPMESIIRSGRPKMEWFRSGRDIPATTARISIKLCST